MEKDNIRENETKDDMEEEVQTSSIENIGESTSDTEEASVTVTDEIEKLTSGEKDVKSPASGIILANILDQVLVAACSSLLVFLCDLILRLFGYMFVRENGALILAGGIIYFIINCIYVPIMEKTKLRSTIAKKILSV